MCIVNLFNERLFNFHRLRRLFRFNVRTQMYLKAVTSFILFSNTGHGSARFQCDCQEALSSFNLDLSQMYVCVYQPRNEILGTLRNCVQNVVSW